MIKTARKKTVREIVSSARKGGAKGWSLEQKLALSGVVAIEIKSVSKEAVSFMTEGWVKRDYYVDPGEYLYYRGR